MVGKRDTELSVTSLQAFGNGLTGDGRLGADKENIGVN